MLVFIGLILVYGILFAILAVSKAILDKDKKTACLQKQPYAKQQQKTGIFC